MIRNKAHIYSPNTIQMNWWALVVFILVIGTLYLLRRHYLIEGFETAPTFDKVSMCPVLAKHIKNHVSKQESLKEESAAQSLSINNDFLDAYRKKFNEMGCT